jgi:general secretion pathway protein A
MYNSYFGFRESPFSVTPDPRFFYANTVYREAFVTLRYGIDAKKGFIAITGEVGTGKTTLLRKLLQTLEDTVHSVFVFNTYLSFPELLELTLHDLGLSANGQSKPAMIQQLNDYLIEQLKLGHTVAILIDEAQNLTDEVLENLRLLSNLETDQEKLIQIVLMGQPELQAKLARPHLRQLKQRIALQCRLHPLKETEVEPYIDSRLQAIGYQGPALFHPEAIERIAFYSQGIPRLMNIICDNALLSAYAVSQRFVSAEMIEEVAHDLDLRTNPCATKAALVPIALAPEGEEEAAVIPVLNEIFRRRVNARTRASVAALLAMFVAIAIAAVIYSSPALFSTSGKPLGLFNRSRNLWAGAAGQSRADSKTEAEAKNPAQRITIQPGSTIQKIATDTYGRNTTLGMDLIKEFNPQIQNLNRVFPGQEVLLPALTRENLLRKQPDGSYRIIVGSFVKRGEADAYIRGLADNRYPLTITSNRVSNDLFLQRVEVHGLKNFDEARRAWNTGLQNQWFAFVNELNDDHRLSKADVTY